MIIIYFGMFILGLILMIVGIIGMFFAKNPPLSNTIQERVYFAFIFSGSILFVSSTFLIGIKDINN